MDLSPKQIVNQLDKYIIGQDEAKKAVAIALRNRYRRAQLPAEIREEITPKNIIMKGPVASGRSITIWQASCRLMYSFCEINR